MVLKDIPVENKKYFSMGWGREGGWRGHNGDKNLFCFLSLFCSHLAQYI